MNARHYRKPLVAANWKMYKTAAESEQLTKSILLEMGHQTYANIVLCPSFPALGVVGKCLEESNVHLGAQNVCSQQEGAFTGEVSAVMLRDLYCAYVILGHSERRSLFQESDALIAEKIKTALGRNLKPIVCVGESLQSRESGNAEGFVKGQVSSIMDALEPRQLESIVIAYEPIWAIGTGKVAQADQVQAMHAFIRSAFAEKFGNEKAEKLRILYGGSVKPNNAAEIFAQADVDGGLIGSAALEAKSFVQIVQATQ